MLKQKKIFKIIIILSIILYIIINSYQDYTYIYKKNIILDNFINDKVKYSDIYSYLKIDKINLKEIVYNINSDKNNLDNGLMLYNLNPIIILGHSGLSVKALFNDLDKLNKEDKISFNNKEYKVFDIYEKKKTDKLQLNGDLILVTCLKNSNDKQLVIVGKNNV